MSTTSSAPAATSSASTSVISASSNLKVVGVILAVTSGLLIGSSFVFKKKGLLRSQAGQVAGEGVAYLKSPLWWLGMIMMILGELCNFAAYAFVEAIVVTPLGALSVVVCAILSSFFLNEKLSFFGWLGCILCILGSVIIALNGPREASVGQIREFQKLFLAPGFLAYASILIAAALVIIFYFGPRYGKKNMLWYILVCSMIGGISVSVTTGLGAAIVQTAMGDNQFKYWFMYFLLGFVVVTLLTEVYYLNVALALFNTAMVTPTYYVIFTFFSMVTTVVLFQGLKASASQILTIVMAFLVICIGITILQMSKVDPVHLSKLDRRSTILLQAARAKTETMEEKGAVGIEDPGMDALRGSFGTVGSIIRARSVRRLSQSSRGTSFQGRPGTGVSHDSLQPWTDHRPTDTPTQVTNPFESPTDPLSGMKRHQLYDAPVPRNDSLTTPNINTRSPSVQSSILVNKRPTIKFDSQDVVHSYHPPGSGDNSARHEHRDALRSPGSSHSVLSVAYPPIRTHDVIPSVSNSSASASTEPESAEDLPSESERDAQTLPLLHRFAVEHEVHSAPPTMNPHRVMKLGGPGRVDLRDVFNAPTTRESLSGQGGDEKERGRSTKRYPKGDGELDREESLSLVERQLEEEDDVPPPGGGIRLVKPSSGNWL